MIPAYLDLRHCDNMELMAQYPDKYFDLAIVDPPFGIGTVKNKFARNKNTNSYKNKSVPLDVYFQELERVSKNSIIWGCQYYIHLLNPKGSFIIWDKKADPDLHNMSSCDVAWYSHRKQIKTFDGIWCGACKIDNEKTIHIHQKPIALYKWLLKNYAKEGDKILDTHLGSMSIAIAVHEMNKQGMNLTLTGCELDEDYYNQAMKRVENACLQMSLI